MLFPKPGSTSGPRIAENEVQLKSGHLIFGKGLAQQVFDGELQAKLAYDEEKSCFVLSKGSLMTIKMRYPKPAPVIVKQKNLHGEVSVNVQEWVLDHQLPENSSALDHSWEDRVSLLTIHLHTSTSE